MRAQILARRSALLRQRAGLLLKSSRSVSTAALKVQHEVSEALANGRPVVALESTIISHGMPFPQNFETAVAVENAVRSAGCTPATIALLNGVPHIGLSVVQLQQLAQASDVRKCSKRDLPLAIAQQAHGATTVAATMALAHAAGIRVFVTGGIGGVHRGYDQTQVSLTFSMH